MNTIRNAFLVALVAAAPALAQNPPAQQGQPAAQQQGGPDAEGQGVGCGGGPELRAARPGDDLQDELRCQQRGGRG